jgi:hypothetical protein
VLAHEVEHRAEAGLHGGESVAAGEALYFVRDAGGGQGLGEAFVHRRIGGLFADDEEDVVIFQLGGAGQGIELRPARRVGAEDVGRDGELTLRGRIDFAWGCLPIVGECGSRGNGSSSGANLGTRVK